MLTDYLLHDTNRSLQQIVFSRSPRLINKIRARRSRLYDKIFNSKLIKKMKGANLKQDQASFERLYERLSFATSIQSLIMLLRLPWMTFYTEIMLFRGLSPCLDSSLGELSSKRHKLRHKQESFCPCSIISKKQRQTMILVSIYASARKLSRMPTFGELYNLLYYKKQPDAKRWHCNNNRSEPRNA